MDFFGISFGKKSAPNTVVTVPSPVTPPTEDGATTVYNASSYFGVSYLDINGTLNDDSSIIQRYRTISSYSVIDIAVENIVNESIVYKDNAYPVSLDLDNLPVTRRLKMMILEEFRNVLQLLHFDKEAYQIFRKWYIDGRIYFQIIVDEKNPQNGIIELRPIDARKIKKVRQLNKDTKDGVELVTSIEEYYVYDDNAFITGTNNVTNVKSSSSKSIKFNKDSIICVNSGQVNYSNGQVIGFLDKCIRPCNQLRMLEDAVVIYMMTRAPERRIFYIDVGNLPKIKADEHVRDVMQRYRNKIVYDGTTGEVKDDRKFASMLEDYWMPTRGATSTKIDTLQSVNPGFTDMVPVEYFKRELYRSLNVPFSRLQSETGFNIGRASEISRDEVNFQKFIQRLQTKFSEVFVQALETQLALKNIVSKEEFEQMMNYIVIKYNKDNYFEELKENEILIQRIEAATDLQQFVGKYYSNGWVRKNIFKQTDEDIEMMDAEIEQEFENPLYYPPVPDADQMAAGLSQEPVSGDGTEDGSQSSGGSNGGQMAMTMADVQHTMSKTINKVVQGTTILIKRGGRTVAKLGPASSNESVSLNESIQYSKINNIQYLLETMHIDETIIIEDSNNKIVLTKILE